MTNTVEEALPGATISVLGTVRGTTTGQNGEFRIEDLPDGNYTVVVSLVGYQRETRIGVQVSEGRETTLRVVMVQSPVPLEQVVVTASRR